MKNNFYNLRVGDLILSPGHFKFFLEDKITLDKIKNDLRTLTSKGLFYYLQQEYPAYSEKSIILNKISDEYFIVDGNRHLFSLYLFNPDITIPEIYECYPRCLRFWEQGIETAAQRSPYEIYVPLTVETNRISQAKVVTDFFKSPPVKTNSIPAYVRFNDASLFNRDDIGQSVNTAGKFLKSKYQINAV